MDTEKAEAYLQELYEHLQDVTANPQQPLNTTLTDRISHDPFQGLICYSFY